jgi:L-lactate dehydrogenase complex protein LldF
MQFMGRKGWIGSLPLAGGWTRYRDMPKPAPQTFMAQYKKERRK